MSAGTALTNRQNETGERGTRQNRVWLTVQMA